MFDDDHAVHDFELRLLSAHANRQDANEQAGLARCGQDSANQSCNAYVAVQKISHLNWSASAGRIHADTQKACRVLFHEAWISLAA